MPVVPHVHASVEGVELNVATLGAFAIIDDIQESMSLPGPTAAALCSASSSAATQKQLIAPIDHNLTLETCSRCKKLFFVFVNGILYAVTRGVTMPSMRVQGVSGIRDRADGHAN